MIKAAFVRGSFLNNFEGQNYIFDPRDIELVGFSSLRPMENEFPFPVVRLPSIPDFLPGSSRAVKVIANRTFGDMQVLFGLGQYIKGFDIVHTADPHYYYSYQLARLRQKGIVKRLLVTSWETIPHNNETVKRKKKIKHFVLEHADRFLCYTQKAKECLVKEGVKPGKIDVVPLGVNADRFHPAKSRKAGPLRLLFAGRLVPEKGILDLYGVFKELYVKAPAFKDARLRIAGSGPLEKRLRRMIRKDKLDAAVTIKPAPYGKMPGLYREADIFTLPSRRSPTWEEQYGMVLVEAMASGLPIAAYDTGAIAEVTGGGALLVKEGDTAALASALLSLASPPERMRIGTIGRERALSALNSRKASAAIARVYKSMLE